MSSTLTRRTVLTGALASAVALTVAACGGTSATVGKDDQPSGVTVDGDVTTITIGATPEPHVTMLQWIQDNLAKEAGLNLDIVEINDYQIPNSSLKDGSLAANFYQTPAFLKSQADEKGYDFTSIANVHVEPMGLYTDKGYAKPADLPEGSTVILNSDPANFARGLQLLATSGLIELDGSVELPADTDVTSNPKKLVLKAIEGASLVEQMKDSAVAAAVINGNYALDGGLSPAEDAIAVEPGEGSPYANLLVVRTEDKDNEHLLKLAELMNSDAFRAYIEQTWTDGSVIPAF